MATKFLDYTGLSYLWGKIKAWCNSIFVTKATDENITGTKTFLGSKKIAFKQSGANDKLGFTLYNNSSKEQGYLEYNPTNKIANVPLFTLGNYATAANELTYIGFRRYSNISGASGAYNLLAPLISDAKTPFNLTTTYTNFYLPLGISDGTNIVTASNSGVVDISSFLTLSGYTKPSTGSALASTDTIIEALGKLEAKVDNSVTDYYDMTPVGSIFYFATDTAPSGYLVCNGNAVSRTTYSDLFNVIGTTYGEGDGSTTFNLPNLTDKFIEGAVTSIGTNIAAGLPNITSNLGWIISGISPESSSNVPYFNAENDALHWYASGSVAVSDASISAQRWYDLDFNASRSSSIYGNSNTVQPPAIKLLPCIKAYNVVSNSNSIDVSSLESELIDNVVHRTGDETINGYKIFTENIALRKDFVKGDTPSSNIYWSLEAVDKNGTNYPNNRIGGMDTVVTTNGDTITQMYAMQNTAGSVNSGVWIGCQCDKNGNIWTFAPTPDTADNSTKIATTAFVKAQGYSLFNERMTTANSKYFLTINDNFANAGWLTVPEAREVLRVGSICRVGQSSNNLGANQTYVFASFNPTFIPDQRIEYMDAEITFLVECTYCYNETEQSHGQKYGILRAHIRFGTNEVIEDYGCSLVWLTNFRFNPARFKLGYTNSSRPLVVLTTDILDPWQHIRFTVLSYGRRDTDDISAWVLHNQVSEGAPAVPAMSGWITSTYNERVYTTGDQDIYGSKFFHNNMTIVNATEAAVNQVYTSLEKGVSPNSTHYATMVATLDKSWRWLSRISFEYYPSKESAIVLYAYKCNASTDTEAAVMSLHCTPAGGTVLYSNVQYRSNTCNHVGETVYSGDSSYTIYAGVNNFDGAGIQLFGRTQPSYAGRFYIRASTRSDINATDGVHYDFVGKPDGSALWTGQTLQATSDERLKTPISSVNEEILDCWDNVVWGEFKYLEAVKEKGNNSRIHIGLIAQSVDRVFKENNLNICKYGILCHEQHDGVEKQVDSDGMVTQNAEPAVDLWMVRYTEALCMEAAYQRRKNKILENRISELERQVSDMLQILQSLKGAN